MSGANNELTDFFQLLKEKACFHDETQPVKDAFTEIESKLVFDENSKEEK